MADDLDNRYIFQ